MNATAAVNEYPVAHDWTDPETGHRWIHLRMALTPCEALGRDVYAYETLKELPRVLKFDGDTFVRTGWNSDNGQVYYRNHMPTAKGE